MLLSPHYTVLQRWSAKLELFVAAIHHFGLKRRSAAWNFPPVHLTLLRLLVRSSKQITQASLRPAPLHLLPSLSFLDSLPSSFFFLSCTPQMLPQPSWKQSRPGYSCHIRSARGGGGIHRGELHAPEDNEVACWAGCLPLRRPICLPRFAVSQPERRRRPVRGASGLCQIRFDSLGKIWSAGFYAWSMDIVLLIIHLTDLYAHPTGKITGDLGRRDIPQCTSPTCNSSTSRLNEDV